jgi:hypothetical protein
MRQLGQLSLRQIASRRHVSLSFERTLHERLSHPYPYP